MASILGIIFSNIHNKEVFEITQVRTIASAPIGGRYRLIDFTLSNLVNHGVNHIGLVTKSNFQSLMDHIGSGKEWDLARKTGGLVILPPYGINEDTIYNTRLEALKRIISFINSAKEEYVILTDCYHVCNVDFSDLLDFHIQKNADITCVYRTQKVANDSYYLPANAFVLAPNKRVLSMDVVENVNEEANVSVDMWILKRELLLSLVLDAMNFNSHSFNKDILKQNVNNLKIYGYKFSGYFGNISSLQSYYDVNMQLLKKEVRQELFEVKGRSIYTKVRDSAPTLYCENAKITNSLIADGCIIDGNVENSILFRGVKVGKGSVIKNSILNQDTDVSEKTSLEYVVTDKNVKIYNKKEIKGSASHLIYVKKDASI